MKKIIISERAKNKLFTESKLNETHVQNLYHFVTLDQLNYILKYGFSLNDKEKNFSISKKLPNFLSFSRNRNGVQGFPFMNTKYNLGGGTLRYIPQNENLCRIEIDGEKLNNYGKIKPFDYIYHLNKNDGEDTPLSSKEEIQNLNWDYPNVSYGEDEYQEIFNQPFSQSEERLFSKLKRIESKNVINLIKRIDFFISDNNEDEKLNKILKRLSLLKIPYFIYTDINKFNLQV